ncbi:Bre2p, partial [Sporobolomyces salmoneus]|uniref:Bre2p n=1 Tax=Sporobolomyces salmoneus TaxID=183962 RepID=UPI0031759015
SFEFFSTRSHPFNKHGFRYTPCGPSPNSPLPVPPQRIIESLPRQVRWSWEDRSMFTYLTQDAQSVTTDKGWRGIRTNVGMRYGDWYWEFRIDRAGGGREGEAGENSWVRVGVGRRESGLNAPVGVDGYSYGIRDKTGDKVHKSHPQQYGKPFSSGTTIGVYLSLPPPPTESSTKTSVRDPHKIMRKRVPILYKNQLYFEQLEYNSSKEMDELLVDPVLKAKQLEAEEKKKKSKLQAAPGTKVDSNSEKNKGPPMRELPNLPGSKLGFWIDGEFQGTAFEDLYDFIPLMKHSAKELGGQQKKEKTNRLVTENHHDDGTTGYYPFVSVFGGGIVTINPGPDFKHTPSQEDLEKLRGGGETGDPTRGWKPLSERYEAFYQEQRRLDDLDELEQIKLLKTVREKEQAKLQRQAEKAERAAAAGGGEGGGVTKKAKISNETMMADFGGAALLNQFQNQVIGTAKGQEESPGNSPRPTTIGDPLLS